MDDKAIDMDERAKNGLTYRAEGNGPLMPTKASRRIDELLVAMAEIRTERNALEADLGNTDQMAETLKTERDVALKVIKDCNLCIGRWNGRR